MNKKIYFNHKSIEIGDAALFSGEGKHMKLCAAPNKEELDKVIRTFLDASDLHSFRIAIKEPFDEFFDRIKKPFSYIEAAGGFIRKGNEFLFIHRHGHWDLPKGKLEKGETIELAAVRECEEECGVKELTILDRLPSTFHIYPYKNGHALKQTYWFNMQTDYNEALIPQQEEDIDAVKWISQKEIESTILRDTYYTISDTLRYALKLSGSKF